MPSFALVGNKETLSKETLKKIQNIMRSVKQKELQRWGKNISYGCSEATDKDYDSLRKLKKSIIIPEKGNF